MAGIVGLLASGALADAPPGKRMNVVFFLTDDQAPNMTGYEGHPQIKTPHLDTLASRSVRFTRCYVPTPQCAPSRATILTGLYPHSHRVVTNPSGKRPLRIKPSADTFVARLDREGYFCGIVGKWHLPYETSPAPGHGFSDYVATHDRSWKWNDCPVWVNGEKQTADKFLTDWNGDRAIEFIDKAGEAPFFLWVCFRAPHGPLVYPPGTEKMYPPDKVDLPETMEVPVDPAHRPASLLQSPPHKGFQSHKPPYDALREARSKYYAMISRVDENVGRVLERLDTPELRENTIVIFASDNGWALGEHRLFAKGPFFYEELARVPLLISHPALKGEARTVEHVVSLVDLAPTILEMVGFGAPMGLQGDSMWPLMQNPESTDWADEEFLEYDEQQGTRYPARGVVTKRFKFIDYLNERRPDSDIVYDLKLDPLETRNVNHPEQQLHYAGVIKMLRQRVESWREMTRDPVK